MKKTIAALLAGCLLTSSLAACAPASAPASSAPASPGTASAVSSGAPAPESAVKGKITFATGRTDMDEQFKTIVDGFVAKYPEAEVEVQPIADYTQTLKTRLASNEAPDVMYTDGGITPTKDLYPGFYAPLDDLGYNKDSIAFYDAGSYEGKVYALCEGVYVTGVLCSMKTLKAAGVESYPKTQDEFFAACEKLKAAGVTPVGSMLKTKWPLSNWKTVLFANETASGDEYYNSLISTDTPFAADSSTAKMLEFVKTVKDKGFFDADLMSSDWDILRTDMSKTGFLVMANFGLGALDGTAPEDVGFFPLPVDNSGKQHTMMTPGWSMAVAKDSKNLDTAKAFVKYWMEESPFQDMTGIIPSLFARKSGNPKIAAFMEQSPIIYECGASPDKYNLIISKAQFDFADLIQETLLDVPVKDVLDKYNAKWADARKSIA